MTVTATDSVTGQSSPPKTLFQIVTLPTVTIYQVYSSKLSGNLTIHRVVRRMLLTPVLTTLLGGPE